jgi:hypothetical protein
MLERRGFGSDNDCGDQQQPQDDQANDVVVNQQAIQQHAKADVEARRWFLMAAAQGSAAAQVRWSQWWWVES